MNWFEHKRILKTLVLTILWFNAYSQVPKILTLTPNAAEVGAYEKFELSLNIEASYSNPFDYAQVEVQAFFEDPSGHRQEVDGFYMEPYEVDLSDGNLIDSGDGLFKIRFSPRLIGTYKYAVTLKDRNGTIQSEASSFKCIASSNKGFIRTGSSNYLEHSDGSAYIPVGENMAWYENNAVLDYKNWIEKLRDAGGNFIRVWQAHWGLGIEWQQGWNNNIGLKRYNQISSAYQDWLYDFCADNGLEVLLTIQHHGPYSIIFNSNWADNPYNSLLGGPISNPSEFFTNPQAKELTQNRIRYILARWGYSPAIMGWELFNEVDLTDDFTANKDSVVAWHIEMAEVIKEHDKNHMVTTSLSRTMDLEKLWNNPLIDFVQVHHYANVDNLHRAAIADGQSLNNSYNKPVLIGEFGLGGDSAFSNRDVNGIHFHNALWAGMMGGALGTSMTWWWESYIDPKNLYSHFSPLSAISKKINWVSEKMDISSLGFMGSKEDLLLNTVFNFLSKADSSILIEDGVTIPLEPEPGRFLYGNTVNSQFRSPPTFFVDYKEEGIFKIKTGSSFSTDPILIVMLDGTTLLNEIPLVDTIYEITIPTGKHEIKVDNIGTDWMQIESYFFSSQGSPIEGYALLSEDKTEGAGWIHQKSYNHNNIINGLFPEELKQEVIKVKGLENGSYVLTWYDPLSGDPIGTVEGNSADGIFTAAIPAFTWDLTYLVKQNVQVSNYNPPPVTGAKIFPNPGSTDKYIIIDSGTLQSPENLYVYNAEGKLISSSLYMQKYQLSNQMPAGMYFIRIKGKTQSVTLPFILVK